MTVDLNAKGRKPRIAIMGEFSAGKSTLCNLLMQSRALPEKVTATRMAPVWMTQGPGQDMRVALDGAEEAIDVNALHSVPFDDTLYIRLHLQADILQNCDFIDFPGISDPNMDAAVWERLLVQADAVIWLTHATQAWRQSEAAVWETVPADVRAKSLLLVTRFDKLTTELDRTRVMTRVEKETAGQFQRVFPISLTDAFAAQDDYEAWTESGAAAMIEHLADLIGTFQLDHSDDAHDAPAAVVETAPAAAPAPSVKAVPEQPVRKAAAPVGPAKPVAEPASDVPRIVPRRVKPSGAMRRSRPEGLRA